MSSTNEHYEAIIKRLESAPAERTKNKPSVSNMKDDLKNYLKGLNNTASNQSQISHISTATNEPSNYLKSEPTTSSLMTYDGPNDFSDYDGNAYADY